ncbi:MAG: CoA transferase, partial [Burkholderiaceae bacterium]|nr:CoA transferase [Burkholderiaceae bacterium]
NRKSVTIDLLRPEGVDLFKRLVAKSDVLVENFRPGTMESWGLGWPQVHEANPGIVMLRVTGYGQTGPYRRRAGFAHIAQAFGGLNYLAGFPGETPVLPGTVPLGDYIASLFGTIGVLVALRHKAQTGKGQMVDVGIYEAVFRVLEESTTDKMFERLSVAMGRPELSSQEMYGDQRKRLAAREIVNQHVIDWVGSLTRHEVLNRCLYEEVPVGEVNSIADIFNDPHFAARGNLVRWREENLGEVVVPGVVPRLSATPGRINNLGPRLGDGNDEVLRVLLGLAAGEIAMLRERNVVR